MISVSSQFAALIAAQIRGAFKIRFRVAWDGVNYIDESVRVASFSYTRSLSEFTNSLLPVSSNDQCTFTMLNTDFRYSPFHVGDDTSIRANLSASIGTYGKPFSLEYGLLISGSYQWCPLFTGYVTSINANDEGATATLTCGDNGTLLLQHKVDSWTRRDLSYTEAIEHIYDLGGTPHQVIADVLPLRVPFVYMDDESPITQCQKIAGSVCGFFFFDALGRPTFRALHQTLANRTDYFLIPKRFRALTPVEQTENLATDIIVGYQTRALGAPDVVYETSTYYTLAPLETKVIDLRLDKPIYYAMDVNETDYVIDNQAGVSMNAYVDVGVLVTGQKVKVTLYNSHAQMPARLVYLRIRGVPLIGGPDEQVEKNIATITGLTAKERVRSVRSEFYLQTHAAASYVADNLAAIFGVIPRLYSLQSANGIPQLDLMDPVNFFDGKQVSSQRKGYVVQISTQYSFPDGLSETPIFAQDITVADVPSELANNTFFIVGHSAIEDMGRVTWH